MAGGQPTTRQAQNQPSNVPGAPANPKVNAEGSGTQTKGERERERQKGRRELKPTTNSAHNLADQETRANMLQLHLGVQ